MNDGGGKDGLDNKRNEVAPKDGSNAEFLSQRQGEVSQ